MDLAIEVRPQKLRLRLARINGTGYAFLALGIGMDVPRSPPRWFPSCGGFSFSAWETLCVPGGARANAWADEIDLGQLR